MISNRYELSENNTELIGLIEGHIYSFIVRYERGKYSLQVNHLSDEYDVITPGEWVAKVNVIISKHKNKEGVIGYGQAPLEVQAVAFRPFMLTLAKQASDRYKQFEYEDCLGLANLVLVKLYKQGYYIHKYLLTKTFYNDIKQLLRKRYNDLNNVSIYTALASDDSIEIIDTLPDIDADIAESENERKTTIDLAFMRLKELLANDVSEREWQYLLNIYGHRATDNCVQGNMKSIKRILQRRGITYDKLLKYILEN